MVQEPLERMSLLNQLVIHAETIKGGALISKLHNLSLHGDKKYRALINKTLSKIYKPFQIFLTK
jgi:hypothetical protein